jgi:hypothetical protein
LGQAEGSSTIKMWLMMPYLSAQTDIVHQSAFGSEPVTQVQTDMLCDVACFALWTPVAGANAASTARLATPLILAACLYKRPHWVQLYVE